MADIIVYDRNGKEVVKEDIETLELDTTTEGKTTIFTHGVAMDNVPIAVDFSNGDMEIDGGGYLVKSAIIQKPETLIPDNIKQGVDIAGIIGTLAGGGGGIVCASGRVNGIGGPMTVTHNLGVVPFLVCIYSVDTITTNTNVDCAVAIDKNIVSNEQGLLRFKDGMSMANWVLTQQLADSDAAAGMGMTYAATATTFRVGASGSSRGLQSGKNYDWFALGVSES